MSMRLLTTTTRNLILTILLFVLVVSGTIWLRLQLDERSQSLVATMTAMESAAERTEHVRRLANNLEQNRDLVAELDSYIIQDERDTITFLSLLDELAVTTGVSLETDSLTVKDGAIPDYDELQVSVTIDGPRAAVETMLDLLETMPYHVFLTSGTFEQESISRGEASANVQLVATIRSEP